MTRMALVLFGVLHLLRTTEASEVTPVAVCAGCHKQQTKDQPDTPMGRALLTGSQSTALRQHSRLSFDAGRFSYEIERVGDHSVYTVREGQEKLTVPIPWAFGLGAAGQTYLLPFNGKWYESRVSYYNAIDGLDYTLGARALAPGSLTEALGKETPRSELALCFGCHTTNSIQGGQVDFEHITPGILCENCHGPAAAHAASVKAGDLRTAASMQRLGKMNSEETFELCGRCHRTWSAIASEGLLGVQNVRFQPYRLTNSKCYDAYDKRISCVACHDPHSHEKQPAASYDSKCNQCHAAKVALTKPGQVKMKSCKMAAKNCATCHMPQVEIPGSHHQFTDHEIRVARAGSRYPN